MKISEIIDAIITDADTRFNTSNHNNDCINVAIYRTQAGPWQAWLTRPSLAQLDRGEVVPLKIHTTKLSEDLVSFFTEKDTLLDVLLDLQKFVGEANEWEDGHVDRFAGVYGE